MDLLSTDDWDRHMVLDPVIGYEAFGYTRRHAIATIWGAHPRFYLRPKYLTKHTRLVPHIPRSVLKGCLLSALNLPMRTL